MARRPATYRLAPRPGTAAAALAELQAAGYRIDLFCFWESASGHGGPMLDPYKNSAEGRLL